ncbi:hypothetical protein KAW18_08710, partial [candidate division WOR-3 bacterium]|nr:hypothetical protein [candidate division WOR-3 bacterium]
RQRPKTANIFHIFLKKRRASSATPVSGYWRTSRSHLYIGKRHTFPIVGAGFCGWVRLSLRGAKRRRNLGGGRDCFAREEKGKTCLAPTCNDQMGILTQPLETAPTL